MDQNRFEITLNLLEHPPNSNAPRPPVEQASKTIEASLANLSRSPPSPRPKMNMDESSSMMRAIKTILSNSVKKGRDDTRIESLDDVEKVLRGRVECF